MKPLILLVCFVLTFLEAQSFRVFYFTNEETECIKKLNIKETTLDVYYAGPPSQRYNFIQCVWQEMEFQNENGEINYAKLKKSFDLARLTGEDNPGLLTQYEKVISTVVDACEKNPAPPGETYGETAANVQNCLIDQYHKFTAEYYKQFEH